MTDAGPLCATLLVCALTACGPQVQVKLVAAGDLAASPEFVRFQVADVTTQVVERFGPYAVKGGLPNEEFASVPPEETFYIDVIGCKSAEESGCINQKDFLARGCSKNTKLGRGESKTITIEVHNAEEGGKLCPNPDVDDP